MLLDGNRRADAVYDAAGLTQRQREAVHLHGGGMGPTEMGRWLGIRADSARTLVHDGLARLRKWLPLAKAVVRQGVT